LEIWVALGGLFIFVIVVGVPYLLVSHTRLRSRVELLERALNAIRAEQGGSQTNPEEQEDQPPAVALAIPATQQSLSVTAAPAPDKPVPTPWVSPQPTDLSSSEQADPPSPPRAFVFRQDRVDDLVAWLRENWVLAAGTASLALAGIFMVQYGAEHGFLSPFWRVMAALGFGALLIAGGEVMRRRFGDEAESAVRYLPSALAGAGLVALFAGTLSARVMYDLIGPETAFGGLCLVSILAVVLGWFYGPLLSAVGIIGATAAPFLVGEDSDTPWVLYYYFTLIALAGLAVDTVKRWAWVSVIVLIATLCANWLLYVSGAGELHFLIAVLIIAAATIVIPKRSLLPHHSGAAFLDLLRTKSGERVFPDFPTRLSFAVTAVATSAALVVVRDATTPDGVYLGLMTLVLLLAGALIWMRQAPALFDHGLMPGVAILIVLLIESDFNGPLISEFRAGVLREPETAPPATVWVLVALGALVSVLAFWRMQSSQLAGKGRDASPVYWALAASVFAPALVMILEFAWNPSPVVGNYPWALAVIAVAALMTLMSERTAHGADNDRRALRVGLFAIAALSLISLAFFLLLAKAALTLALAVLVVLVVAVERHFKLPVLNWFVQLGVAVITYRLVVDPGFVWAVRKSSSDVQVWLAYLGTLALLAGAWRLSKPLQVKSALILESVLWTIGAVFVCVLLFRQFGHGDIWSHWGAGLLATVWGASLMNQLYRMQASNQFTRLVRGALAVLFALVTLFWTNTLFVDANPLTEHGELVLGPPILDSLSVAYLPLALVFAVAAWKLTHFARWMRIGFTTIAALLAAWYVTLEIRRLWRGNDLTVAGVTDPELYSYTVGLLLTSVGLLFLAFNRRSIVLRKLAMAGVGLTIAKVFLIDMSGLSGLIRVFSFMGLGLSLVGLAWLSRTMNAQWKIAGPSSSDRDASE
jgi:uncharacterized membrane protein